MKKKMKVQIDEALFSRICAYFLLGHQEKANYSEICRMLEEKVDAMARRELYGQYKTAQTAEQREQARQEYLQRIGMQDDFRW